MAFIATFSPSPAMISFSYTCFLLSGHLYPFIFLLLRFSPVILLWLPLPSWMSSPVPRCLRLLGQLVFLKSVFLLTLPLCGLLLSLLCAGFLPAAWITCVPNLIQVRTTFLATAFVSWMEQWHERTSCLTYLPWGQNYAAIILKENVIFESYDCFWIFPSNNSAAEGKCVSYNNMLWIHLSKYSLEVSESFVKNVRRVQKIWKQNTSVAAALPLVSLPAPPDFQDSHADDSPCRGETVFIIVHWLLAYEKTKDQTFPPSSWWMNIYHHFASWSMRKTFAWSRLQVVNALGAWRTAASCSCDRAGH